MIQIVVLLLVRSCVVWVVVVDKVKIFIHKTVELNYLDNLQHTIVVSMYAAAAWRMIIYLWFVRVRCLVINAALLFFWYKHPGFGSIYIVYTLLHSSKVHTAKWWISLCHVVRSNFAASSRSFVSSKISTCHEIIGIPHNVQSNPTQLTCDAGEWTSNDFTRLMDLCVFFFSFLVCNATRMEYDLLYCVNLS